MTSKKRAAQYGNVFFYTKRPSYARSAAAYFFLDWVTVEDQNLDRFSMVQYECYLRYKSVVIDYDVSV
jgi:hypothetical protein